MHPILFNMVCNVGHLFDRLNPAESISLSMLCSSLSVIEFKDSSLYLLKYLMRSSNLMEAPSLRRISEALKIGAYLMQ